MRERYALIFILAQYTRNRELCLFLILYFSLKPRSGVEKKHTPVAIIYGLIIYAEPRKITLPFCLWRTRVYASLFISLYQILNNDDIEFYTPNKICIGCLINEYI